MDLQMKLAADGWQRLQVAESAALPEWAHYKDMVYATTFEPIAIVYTSDWFLPKTCRRRTRT
jgi:iron(III) transport system substrate-binding protein